MISCLQKNICSGLAVFIVLLTLITGCTSDKPKSPGVNGFHEQMLKDFDALESKLIPAIESDKQAAAVSKAIEIFIKELINDDRRVYGVGMLDTSGEYVTGYVIEDNAKKKLIKDKYKGMNFHSFKVVDKIIKSGKIMQEMLYLQDARILAVGFPVSKDRDVLGIICFSFKSHEFEKKWGISEKEFFEIDFNKNR